MIDFLRHLFDTSGFPPRWYCGAWSDGHGWLHILSNLAIWASYCAIPAVLISCWRKRRKLPFSGVVFLFAAFILACGFTHLMDAAVFWWPAYRLSGLLKFCTAVVSVATVVALARTVPRILEYRDPNEMAALSLLRAERELLRTTLSSIGDGVITTDTQGRVAFLNPVAEALTGWTNALAAGQPLAEVFRIVNETTRAEVPNPALRALEEGVIVGLANHTLLIAKDGTERPIDDSAAPIELDTGRAGAVLVFHDISDRKASEDRLAESEERLRLATEAAGLGIWVWEPGADRVTWENDRMYEIFGWPRDAAPCTAEKFARDLVHPADAGRFAEAVAGAVATGDRFYFEGRFYRSDGGLRWVEFVGRPAHASPAGPPVLHGTAADITVRRLAEEKLWQSEGQFRTLVETIPQLAWAAEADGSIFWYNRRWFDYTGTTLDEMKGWGWKAVHDPAELPRVLAEWTSCIETGRVFDMVFPIRSAKGEYRPFLTRVVPFYDSDGKLFRWFGTNTDIGREQATQDRLRQLTGELSEADRRKDEFLATLAHELRNPLAPIRTGLQVLSLTAHDPAASEKVRAMMERQLVQMVRLVDDLLDVSRITRNKLELRRVPMPVADAVRSAVETTRPLVDASGQELSVELPDGLFVDGDPTRLSQVFANLINNAAKYGERGGKIRVTASRVAGRIRVEVADTGIGISAEYLPQVFDMFSQVDRSLEKSQGGLGIGLTLVKRLTEMHGGEVRAASGGLGMGSTFTVDLPEAGGPPAAGSRVTAEAGGPVRASLRVLVADDNEDSAESLAMMCGLLGCEVRVANDGREAVRVAEEFRPDIALLDIGMPKLNGYEACRAIRQIPGLAGITVVAQTGWGMEEDLKRSADAGFDRHFVKPVDPALLRELLVGKSKAG